MYHEESQIQRACVRWFGLQHRELDGLLFAVPNGGRRGKVEAAIMKAEGVYPGVADLLLLVPRGRWGLYYLWIWWLIIYAYRDEQHHSRQGIRGLC